MFADGEFTVAEDQEAFGLFLVEDAKGRIPQTLEEDEELARLFEAAPEMLAFLESLEHREKYDSLTEICNAACVLLGKARGN